MKNFLALAAILLSSYAFAANTDGTLPTNDNPAELGTDHSPTETVAPPVPQTTIPMDAASSSSPSMSENYVINFEKGQKSLTDNQKNQLRAYMNAIKSSVPVEQVKVAVWADRDLPKKGTLSKEQRNLATARGKSIEDFVQDELGISDVEVFAMANHDNWLAKNYGKSESDLSSEFAKNNAPLTTSQLQTFQDEGAAMRAIIIPVKK